MIWIQFFWWKWGHGWVGGIQWQGKGPHGIMCKLGYWCAEVKQRKQTNCLQPSLTLRCVYVVLADVGFCFVLGAILIWGARLKKYTQISKLPLLLEKRKVWPAGAGILFGYRLPKPSACQAAMPPPPPNTHHGSGEGGGRSVVEQSLAAAFAHFLSCLALVSIHLSSPPGATWSNTSDTARDWAPQGYTSLSIMNQVDVNFLSIQFPVLPHFQ